MLLGVDNPDLAAHDDTANKINRSDCEFSVSRGVGATARDF